MLQNINFEKFTKEIYECLLGDEKITVDVKHNVTVKGKSNDHQIDVFWSYEIAGITQKVAIECKLLNRKVSIGQVRDFYSVLIDIGTVNGIIVTNIGYQSGAIKFAEHYGINLFVLNKEPNRRIIYHKLTRDFLDVKINLDYEWIKNNVDTSRLPPSIDLGVQQPEQMIVYNKRGKKFKDFRDLEKELIPKLNHQKYLHEDTPEHEIFNHEFKFPNHYYKIGSHGMWKINGVSFVYKEYFVTIFDETIAGESVGKGILANALSGKIIFFDKDGKPHS